MQTTQPNIDEALNEHEVAQITRRSVATVRRDRLQRRGIPFIKIGGCVRYLKSDLTRYFDSLPRHGNRN